MARFNEEMNNERANQPERERKVTEKPKPGSYTFKDLDQKEGKRPVWKR